ncbi:phage-related protein [Shouchella clausii KSM-K16]|uniref:Phage-related protein n=1 Tax=Shouchella clausii (strain KSM-K16) TaxID=66692 RepID=Q5WI94_SHOC1|nr:DUF3310 domain-containing protein [Shouchella clausii]BAD63911.1 phage-related protein [Shouchella clausii KSM-K16]
MTRPSHYKSKIDPLAYMKENMSAAGYEGFLIGNVIKYVTRYPKKNGLEDLKKAKDYLNKAIELYEEEEEENRKKNLCWICAKCLKPNSRTILRGSTSTKVRCAYCGSSVRVN